MKNPTEREMKLLEYSRAHTPSRDPSHDFLHVSRVYHQALKFGRELGAKMEILGAAALLHDIIQVPKNHPDRERASAMAAEKAAEILRDFEYSESEISAITTAILEHSYSARKKPSSLESAILQDADRLDAIGAIGVIRAFACGATMGSAFYQETDPEARSRELDDKKYALDHLPVKLYKLLDTINTEPGRREATKRTEFMRKFAAEFLSEI